MQRTVRFIISVECCVLVNWVYLLLECNYHQFLSTIAKFNYGAVNAEGKILFATDSWKFSPAVVFERINLWPRVGVASDSFSVLKNTYKWQLLPETANAANTVQFHSKTVITEIKFKYI